MSANRQSLITNERFVVAVVGLLIAAVLGYSAFNAYQGYRLALKHAETRVGGLASAVERHADQTLEGIGNALSTVDTLLAAKGYDFANDPEGIHLALRNGISTSPAVKAIFVLNRQGHAVYSSRTDDPRPVDLSDRAYFRMQVDPGGRRLFIGAPVLGRVGYVQGRWVIPVSLRMVGRDETFRGVVAAVVSVDYLAQFYGSIFADGSVSIGLLSESGTVLAFDEATQALVQRRVDLPELTSLPDGDHGVVHADLFGEGVARVVGFHKSDHFPIIAVVATPRHAALADWRSSLWTSGAIAAAMVLTLLAVGLLSLRVLGREARARDELHRSEDRFRQLIEGSIQGVLVHWDFKPIFANQALADMLGYDSPAELLQVDLMHAHPAEEREGAYERVQARMQGRSPSNRFETRLLRRDGTPVWVEVLATRIHWEGRPVILAAIADINERKRVEAERQLLAAAVEQSGDGVMVTDPAGTIRFVNTALEHLAGYPREELLGRDPSVFKSGRQSEETYTALWRTVSAGEVWRGRLVNRRKDGTLYDEEMTVSPVRDEVGAISHYIAVKKDVTEERMLEQRMRQSQKLEAIGALAGGIAHDFNNILTPIMGYAEILQRRFARESREYEAIQVIGRAANRAKSLISQILLFSRQSKGSKQSVKLTALVKEVLKMLRSTLPSTIDIRQEIAPDLLPVNADITQIHTLLMNLSVNAGQAMADGGRLTVRLRNVQLNQYRTPEQRTVHGTYVCMTVEDTGVGMTPEVLAHAFEPFFTTKEIGQGTGLGLASVYGIVQEHEGFLEVDSAPGRGTRFDVYLPVQEEARSQPEADTAIIQGGHERILFVDDEEMIGRFCAEGLQQIGYRVTALTCPVSALERFREDPQAYDLVITDHAMPGYPGERLAREVLALRPDIPIVLCTGNLDDVSEEQMRADGIREVVHKPFSISELSRTVHAVLRGEGRADAAG